SHAVAVPHKPNTHRDEDPRADTPNVFGYPFQLHCGLTSCLPSCTCARMPGTCTGTPNRRSVRAAPGARLGFPGKLQTTLRSRAAVKVRPRVSEQAVFRKVHS